MLFVMQGDTLRRPELAGSSAWSSGRFTTLLLQHNEYYFQRHDAVALLPLPLTAIGPGPGQQPPTNEAPPAKDAAECLTEPPTQQQPCTGVLHVCSKSIFFEPSDIEVPVICVPLAKIERFTRWDPDAQEREVLRSYHVVLESDARHHSFGPSTLTGSHSRSTASPPGSQASSKAKGGWFSGLTSQLLATARSSHRRAHASVHRASRMQWELCQIAAEHVVTLLARDECTLHEACATRHPMLIALQQEVQPDDAGNSARALPGPAGTNAARTQPLECSALITLLMSDVSAKLDSSGLGAAPWAPASALVRKLIREHEMRVLASPLSAATLEGNQRVLCRGRAVRVLPLAETPGRLVLTDKNIFFRPFCVAEDGEEQVARVCVCARA